MAPAELFEMLPAQLVVSKLRPRAEVEVLSSRAGARMITLLMTAAADCTPKQQVRPGTGRRRAPSRDETARRPPRELRAGVRAPQVQRSAVL